jgi:hypothetical protein
MQGIHGFQDEIARHVHTVLLFGMAAEYST